MPSASQCPYRRRWILFSKNKVRLRNKLYTFSAFYMGDVKCSLCVLIVLSGYYFLNTK